VPLTYGLISLRSRCVKASVDIYLIGLALSVGCCWTCHCWRSFIWLPVIYSVFCWYGNITLFIPIVASALPYFLGRLDYIFLLLVYDCCGCCCCATLVAAALSLFPLFDYEGFCFLVKSCTFFGLKGLVVEMHFGRLLYLFLWGFLLCRKACTFFGSKGLVVEMHFGRLLYLFLWGFLLCRKACIFFGIWIAEFLSSFWWCTAVAAVACFYACCCTCGWF